MLVLLFGATDAVAEQPTIGFSAGHIGVKGRDDFSRPQWFGIEYRTRTFSKFKFRKGFGYLRAGNGAGFLSVETHREFALGRGWVFNLSSGPGYFHKSDEIDLGGALEFRTAGELGYTFPGGARLGIVASHLSNAGISNRNPGVETLSLIYTVPL